MSKKKHKKSSKKKADEDNELSGEVIVAERRTSTFQSLKDMVKKRKTTKKSKKKVIPLVEILDDSKREGDNNILRQYLGVDNYGMCLSHPDQIVIHKSAAGEELKTCMYCRSRDCNGQRSIIQQRILQRRDWDITVLPLKRCPFFYKYFAMMEMNIPMEHIQNAAFLDRQHTLILELNPEEPIAYQGVPTLQASLDQANELFLFTALEDNEEQVQRAMQRRRISLHVTEAIDKSMAQYRAKQLSTFRRGVKNIIRVNKFLGAARREDELLFDDSQMEGEYNNSLRMNLGMDNFGMCLRHPNNQICSDRCTKKLDPVQTCRICKSEKLAGGKYLQRKELGAVVGQIQKLQRNKKDWHQRTNILYYGRDYDSICISTRDESSRRTSIVPAKRKVTMSEWEQGIMERVKQVQAWDGKNALRCNPVYAKYFRLLEIGVPFEAVKETAILDGLNADVLSLDPNDSLENQKDKLTDDELEELRAVIPEDSTLEELENTVQIVDAAFDKKLLSTSFAIARSKHQKKAVKKHKKAKKKVEKKEKKEKKKERKKAEKKKKKTKPKETEDDSESSASA